MRSKTDFLLNEIPLTDGQLVVSKGVCAFQDVINGFNDAKRISVVTFNISKSRDQLLGALKDSSAFQRLITNIPNRRESYAGGAMKTTEETIRIYLNRLDPTNFNPLARVYFSFKNHAKIIKTDKIAYVGSANFSDESRSNWEAGVILRDPTALNAIEAVIDKIEEDSFRYFGIEMQKLVSPILAARNELSEMLERFSWRPTRPNRSAFIGILKEIDDSFEEADTSWGRKFVCTGPISSSVNREVLEQIGSKLRDFDHIDNLITKAENGEIDFDQVYVNKDGEIPEWGVESAIDSMDRKRDNEILAIRRLVGEFISQIDATCSEISASASKIDDITQKHKP